MQVSRSIYCIVLAVALIVTGCKEKVTVGGAGEVMDVHLQSQVEDDHDIHPDLLLLSHNLHEYLDQQAGTYGIYLLDVLSGEGIGINTKTVFPAASTMKLPMTLFILDQIAKGQATLDEQLTYISRDWEDGTGYLQSFVAEGDSFAVEELIDYAIRFSDNIATNILVRRFGFSRVYEHIQHLGGTLTWFDPETIGTTPQEMAGYMYAAHAETTANEQLRRLLLDVLAETVFQDRIRAGIPIEVRVEHKIGTLPGVVNDVAFVYGDRPFVLAIFSMGVEEATAVLVIEHIAEQTYKFLNNL